MAFIQCTFDIDNGLIKWTFNLFKNTFLGQSWFLHLDIVDVAYLLKMENSVWHTVFVKCYKESGQQKL